MNKIGLLYILVPMALAALACDAITEVAETPLTYEKNLVFSASHAEDEPDTRTIRLDGGSTWWNPDEVISVFYGRGSEGGSKFISQNDAVAKTVTFSGSIQVSDSGNDYWAVYPYSQDNSCDGESVTTVIPSVQNAVRGNFSDNVFPCLAKSKTQDLAFWNICGGVKFSVSRGDVKAIVFRGNNGEVLAGKVRVGFDSNGRPAVSEVIKGEEAITVYAPGGGTFASGKFYYLTALPANLTCGFTLSFIAEEEKGSFIQSEPVSIKRSIFGVLRGVDQHITVWKALPLKSITLIPERVSDGFGVITMKALKSNRLDAHFPYVKQLSSPSSYKAITYVPTTVSCQLDPQIIEVDDYDWSFVNNTTSYSSADKTDLIQIVSPPVRNGSRYDCSISLKKLLSTSSNEKNVIALKATGREDNLTTVVSDYVVIESEDEYSYSIIDKRQYNESKVNYRTDYIEFDDKNTIDVYLPYNEEIDLLDYVETYAEQSKTLVSDLGVMPQYQFMYAGKTSGAGVIVGPTPDSIRYEDINGKNHNISLALNGSWISAKKDNNTTGYAEVGSTPLIYARSYINTGGKKQYLAECLLKVMIVAYAGTEPTPPKPQSDWSVFIHHDVRFKQDDLPHDYSYTYKGYSGTVTASRTGSGTSSSKDLQITWNEFDKWVLHDPYLDMPFDSFGRKYDIENPKLILSSNGKEPGSSLPSRNACALVNINDLFAYYGEGVKFIMPHPQDWSRVPFPISVYISKSYAGTPGTHYIYVLFPAMDNTKYTDVVVEFSFTVEPHQHEYTIDQWTLNPDVLLGSQNKLVSSAPSGNYSDAVPDTYAAISAKGTTSSYLLSHFKSYGQDGGIKINNESSYRFTVVNYQYEDVCFSAYSTGTIGSTYIKGKSYSTCTLTAAEMQGIVNGLYDCPALVLQNSLLSDIKPVVIQVTEICSVSGESRSGYYYVVFEPAVRFFIDFNEIALGTFPSLNDYALAHEIVSGIYDSPAGTPGRQSLVEWRNGKWTATSIAALYGFNESDTFSVNVDGVIFYDDKDSKGNYILSESERTSITAGSNDSRASFAGRLSVVSTGAILSPAPSAALSESCVNWWNSGGSLVKNKEAFVSASVVYQSVGGGVPVSVCSGRTKVTVLANGGKAHPYHKADGSVWD